ncbi:nucleic acid-binding protein [Lojkania enalia]|uniref:rRNA biogenesis protein RRP5 n=1 Tax=Lojkania enalia TaxID=147567 RepID=A0A9P4JXF9_9PLEO|nr:nucleic acid-binding protein [Didymosphaeria enalia]
MSAMKRKADAANASAKKEGPQPSERSAKRRRKSDAATDNATPSKPEKAVQKSIFKDEEKAFPRGGASLLTPLEHKQIQIKATQDVLFEQAGIKRTGEDGLSDIASDVGAEEAPKAGKKKKSKKSKNSHSREEEKKVRVEGLSYKKLVPGTMVLGQVADITSGEIVLSLPNNLSGVVPLTAISQQLTTKIEKLIGEEEASALESSDSEDLDDVDLKRMFHVGQYLRGYVTSVGDNANGSIRPKRRIELSIDPGLVNRGITKSSIIVNSMIQASVVSAEDHGLVMDMGLDEPQSRGFIGKGELGQKAVHSAVQEGAVFLCLVTGFNSDRRIIKLSADQQKSGNLKKPNYVTEAATVDIFLPGTAVDLLVVESTATTVTGKIMGLLDATADIVHSGAAERTEDLSEKYEAGSKIKARVINTFPTSDPKKLGVSLLDHVLSLSTRIAGKAKEKRSPLDILPIATIVEEAKVMRVEPIAGLYLDLGVRGVVGFAHISRLDGKVDKLSGSSGPFNIGSKHRARVIGYNAMDGSFQVSLEQRVLDQQFLRIEEVPIGQVVKGKVHKFVTDKNGSTGVLVHLSEGITGLVPDIHLADVRLQHPERKFREGTSVTARVLSTNAEKGRIRLTLKKSLVNSDTEPWTDCSQIVEGATGPGTLVDIKPEGALVHFYGDLKAWLPVAEMSETFIEDATRHFQKGQVVNVRVISIDREARRMVVSCKDPESIGPEKEAMFQSLNPGDIVQGTVVEKSDETVTIDLGHGVKGALRIGHLTDGSEKKDKSTMARIRVGGPLEDIIVLDKHHKSRTVTLSNKPSLRKAAQAETFISHFEDIRAGNIVHGFVRGVLPDKLFIEFGGGVVGLLFQSQLPDDMREAPNFGVRQDQSITARVTHVDVGQSRFWLSMKSETDSSAAKPRESGEATLNAIDKKIKTTLDLTFGSSTTARIRSRKSTQLNVHLADNVQGRISVAELFDKWEDIEDKKHPVNQFKMNDIIQVRVLGRHDARNHRFLPITNRQGTIPMYELTAKMGKLRTQFDVLSLDKITPGSSYVAFVNNIANRYVWVNLSANVRGRIELLDLSDDLSLLSNVEENFPIGSALKVRVKSVDATAGRLDLTASSSSSAGSLTLKDLSVGLILPARVTKVNCSSVIVQINENIAGPIPLEHLADNYDKANPSDFRTGEIVRVCVIEVDLPNKRIGLSARPSRVLNSSLSVKDPEIKDRFQLKVDQVVRGFIRRVADNGLFIRLGPHVDAFVRISHLSDTFNKDWKSAFQVDQLVTGKIISLKENYKNPQMSLKKSIMERKYVPTIEFGDIEVGQIVTAKVRHVEDYGVFLVVDNSENVSGLCHKSQMADNRVEDVKALYKEGDAVKAKVLKVNPNQRRISFGLKYSYFEDEGNDDTDDENGTEDIVDDKIASDEDITDGDVEMRSVYSAESDEELVPMAELDENRDEELTMSSPRPGLNISGFDWTGATLDFNDHNAIAGSSSEEDTKKKKKHKKATIKEDRTGDLDTYGPQSVADYERLLLGQPNSAVLWVQYMVFQRDLNEIDKARQIARRALATINPREENERLDVWTALLHLENGFGNDDAIEETFKEACQYNDSREVHERMIKIYITSGKLDKADALYQAMMKNKSFTPTTSLWLSYASFLMSRLQPPSPSRARALLQRAMQSVPESEHRYLTHKFAALEFKSPNGDPERGRTIFEGLVSAWPKKYDLWDTYLSLEIAHGGEENVRNLFERITKQKMKKKRAATKFSQWRHWEESKGNKKGVERVNALEVEWVSKKEGDEEVK